MKSRTKGNLLLLLTAFLWSFLGVTAKYVSTDGILAAGITSLAGLVVIRVCFIKHKLRINKLTVSAGLALAGMNITFYAANKLTTVTNTIVLQYLSPVFVLLINILFLKYKPDKKQIGILLLCMSGMVIFFVDQLTIGNILGNLLALLSGLLFAISFILNAMPENDPKSGMLMNHFTCFLFALLYAILAHKSPVPQDMGLLLLTGILITGFSSVFYAIGMKRTTALNANMIALSEVFMAPVWAFFLFHERLSPLSLFGIVIIICSIVMESYFEVKRG